jgi:hypothetical protein
MTAEAVSFFSCGTSARVLGKTNNFGKHLSAIRDEIAMLQLFNNTINNIFSANTVAKKKSDSALMCRLCLTKRCKILTVENVSQRISFSFFFAYSKKRQRNDNRKSSSTHYFTKVFITERAEKLALQKCKNLTF